MEKGRKLKKRWDIFQGRSINLLSSFGPRGTSAKRVKEGGGGGGIKMTNCRPFIGFFNQFFPSLYTVKAFPYFFVER